MNVCSFVGRVGQDPKPLGDNGARFSMAIDEYNSQTKSRETLWINCVAFGKTAETVKNYVEKGRLVGITARYQVRKYQSGGEERTDHGFIVDRLELLPDGSQKRKAAAQEDEDSGGLW